ncbi:MAG: hypothetical protein GY719_09335 [bacterium]|nr:hypothetical protein [bacterium]
MATPTTTRPGSIASRLRSFGVVHAALRVQSGEGVSELDRRKARALAGGRRPASDSAFEGSGGAGYLEAFAHLSAELSAAKAKMVSANSIHLGRLAEVVGLQQRRDDLKGALYSRFVKVRRLFETLYGSGRGFPVLAVSGRTPRHATGLVAQVRETAGFLAKPRVELPRLDVAGITVDPPATAAQLAAEADELDGALVDLDEALKLAEITRQAKNDAIAAYDDTFLRVARLAESLFHFAGLHELAKRLRPSTRRPGRRLADEGPEPDSGDTVAPPPAAAETTGEPEAGAPVVEIETFVARAADRRHRDSGRD